VDEKTLLQVKDLQIKFKQGPKYLEAVRGISFEIGKNEVVSLVGESGSGKTVTALSIMGLFRHKKRVCDVSGNILFSEHKKNLLSTPEDEMIKIRGSRISMIFQEPFTALNPVIPIGEQINEAIIVHKSLGRLEAKEVTLKMLERMRLSDPLRVYESYPHLLSGGERQRSMIAMAVSLNPSLLIADEPTTSLDVTIQKEILELILELKDEIGMSILFITHDFGIVKKVADRVLVMKDGSIIERGEKNDILSSPKEDYTKKLLLAIPKIKKEPKKKDIPEGDPVITIRNVNKTFSLEKGLFKKETKKVKALENISFDVIRGKTLGIVGESGSGKTTLAKILEGLLKADSGKIDSKASSKNSMQIVFQDPFSSLDPRMRMENIVLEGPTIKGISKVKKEAILKDVLKKVRLDLKDRKKYPHEFSGGQRQRIAIARSLAVNPDILILDEPVSSLDVIIESEILNLLKNLQKELSLTYIFISHDLRIVEYMADYVAVMEKGKIVELAGSNKIYTSPMHAYTKKLLSCILTI